MEDKNDYYGRIFVESQLSDELKEEAEKLTSMVKRKDDLTCNRCGSIVLPDNILQTGQTYCRECLVFGRNISDSYLYYFPQKSFPKNNSLNWQGQLTPYQNEVSEGMVSGIAEKKDLLVHAVTGAGKTEMIYHSVAKIIDDGGCVCIASPRIDVCLELYKRMSRDFLCPITLLHGEAEPYKRAPLIIATTHQLLKFYQAFDLLIIDEVDAFPFVDNKMLYYAVNQSLKKDGVKIFLTATSTDELDKKVRKGDLKKLHLARRFHANPLVVPKMLWLSGVLKSMKKGKYLKN